MLDRHTFEWSQGWRFKSYNILSFINLSWNSSWDQFHLYNRNRDGLHKYQSRLGPKPMISHRNRCKGHLKENWTIQQNSLHSWKSMSHNLWLTILIYLIEKKQQNVESWGQRGLSGFSRMISRLVSLFSSTRCPH